MADFGFVFPGQGSQDPGMLAELAKEHPLVRESFAEASDVLGMDLWEIVRENPDNRLNQTDITQPALLTASVAIMRLWEKQGGRMPSIVAGHSLGEYSALVCARSLGFATAVKLVHLRGQFMQSATGTGTGKMAAIVGLELARVEEICAEASVLGAVSPANLNSPQQTVIAGQANAVEKAITLSRKAGARRALPLNVSVPSHCVLMQPAAEQLQAELESVTLCRPGIPVIQNTTAAITSEPGTISENLVSQLCSPVRWVDCVRVIAESGVIQVVECGPGRVLSGLIRRIDPSLTSYGTDNPTSFASTLAAISA